MAMGKVRQEVEDWAKLRLRMPCGKGWSPDTKGAVFCVMENHAPYTWRRNPNSRKEYRALVLVMCRYIHETGDARAAYELGSRVTDDFRDSEWLQKSLSRLDEEICLALGPENGTPD